MAKWRPLTENQKRQMKQQIKHNINQIGFIPRTKRKLARNREEKK